jgi:tellurite resistance-related uncharacterized protein
MKSAQRAVVWDDATLPHQEKNTCAEEQSKFYQLHVLRGKVTLAAIYLRRGGVVRNLNLN